MVSDDLKLTHLIRGRETAKEFKRHYKAEYEHWTNRVVEYDKQISELRAKINCKK